MSRAEELAAEASHVQVRGPITDYFRAGPVREYATERGLERGRVALCRCVHGKEWPKGDAFEGNGGQACRECCLAVQGG